MKTIYISIAILATALVSQNAAAKLGANRPVTQVNSPIEINVEAEITDHINTMLGKLQTPKIAANVNKQLNRDNLKLTTNELVQEMSDALPKFKVVVAD